MQIKVIPLPESGEIKIAFKELERAISIPTEEAESFCLDLRNAILHNERAARPVLTHPVTPGIYRRGGGSEVTILKVLTVAGKERAFGFDQFGGSFDCATDGHFGNSDGYYPAMDLVERIGDLPEDLK